jgi:hypothetical protein
VTHPLIHVLPLLGYGERSETVVLANNRDGKEIQEKRGREIKVGKR